MGFLSYDTKNFTEQDYQKIENLFGFSVRQSTARGENNRGRIISVDTLLIDKEDIEEKLPEGFAITSSTFAASDGCIVALHEETISFLTSIQEEYEAHGEESACRFFVSLIKSGLLRKKEDILPILDFFLDSHVNIFFLYQSIPQLERLYFEDERTKNRVQELLDKVVTGQLSLSQITNPFDRRYIQGICSLLHIQKG